jgi:hypothetical protein
MREATNRLCFNTPSRRICITTVKQALHTYFIDPTCGQRRTNQRNSSYPSLYRRQCIPLSAIGLRLVCPALTPECSVLLLGRLTSEKKKQRPKKTNIKAENPFGVTAGCRLTTNHVRIPARPSSCGWDEGVECRKVTCHQRRLIRYPLTPVCFQAIDRQPTSAGGPSAGLPPTGQSVFCAGASLTITRNITLHS